MAAFAPELAKLYEENNDEKSFAILKKLTFIYALVGLIIAILFVVFGRPLIILVSGKTYLSAYPHLVILMIAFFFSLLYAPYTTYRRARDGMDFFFKINALWLIAFLFFVPITIHRLGLYAFSSAVLFATLIVLVYCFKDYLRQ